ncbi:MAG: c-type cytochrome [Halobacteriovoraceae bacterium]|jgi:cytochrome c peroxidase|nr:c-type cytochrome [Halobacteriovoraceae bacterium]
MFKIFILFLSISAFAQENLTPIQDLGKKLFFDPLLSGSNMMSCSSCHNPSLGWSDGLPLAVGHGHKILNRRTPTIINADLQEFFFWDGRANSLEEQALGPIQSPSEMNQNIDELEKELSDISGYVELFKNVFNQSKITISNITKAIASYERTITAGETPYKRYLQGDDTAISDSAIRGFRMFQGHKAKCFHCHNNDNLSDGQFWDIGLNDNDLGLGALSENSQNTSTHHRFKTPTLWGIADRSPYMHNGNYKTLREVVEHYNKGGNLIGARGEYIRRATMPHFIRPLNLSEQDKTDLVNFLKTLSFTPQQVIFPKLPRN